MVGDSLKIIGYGDAPVPNELFRHSDPSDRLALILPGMGYTTAMPLLYYTGEALLHGGWDVLLVNYDYRDVPGTINDAAFEDRYHTDIQSTIARGVASRSYDSVVLVGKSLGTLGLAHLVGRDLWPINASVWLTPLLRRDAVRAVLEEQGERSFMAIGDADPHFDVAIVDQLKAAAVDTVVVEGADHSMDIRGNIPTSIRALDQVMTRLEAFLDRVSGAHCL